MDFYTRSLEEARRLGDLLGEAFTLDKIGEVCLEFGEIKEALDYLLRAYETLPDEEEGDSGILSSILLDIGSAYHRMGNWSLAREFAEKSMALAKARGDLQIECRCWHILGQISMATDGLEMAASEYLESLDLCARLKNQRERASVLLDLGAINCMTGDVERALERFTMALENAEGIGAKRLINAAYERLSQAYERMGDFRQALDYFKRFSRFEHEALNEDASRKIKNITVQYEVEKSRQEAEIYRLKNIELKEKTEELEGANRQILAMADTGRLITASLDLDTIVDTIYSTLSAYIPFDLFALALFEEEERSLDYRAYFYRGKRIQRSRLELVGDRGYAAACLRDRRPVFVPVARPEDRELLQDEPREYPFEAGSFMFLPLAIDDRAIGVLTIQGEEPGLIEAKHLRLAQTLAPYVAIAVENSLIHDRLETLNRAIRGEKEELEKAAVSIAHIANHDPLTGLPNRRLLFELLQKTFDIAERSYSKVGVIYIDLDDFKPINDRFGHSAGDRALVDIAGRLRSILRASDTVARVGGDEFVAVLAAVKGREDIALAARKLLDACARPLAVAGSDYCVGFSMGIAIFPDDADSIEGILNAADAAMYSVKRNRKNGFAFAARALEEKEGTPASGNRRPASGPKRDERKQ
jgi:diguanylate cyclase (GGDEF)-like protein